MEAAIPVAQLAAMLKARTLSPEIAEQLAADNRIGVIKLLEKWKKDQEKENREKQRLNQLYKYERLLRQQGYSHIAGIDEAGRGPLAGPVTIGYVILPLDCHLPQLNDSKKLTAAQREGLYQLILEKALCATSFVVDVPVIDEINIYQATRQGMYSVIKEAALKPDAVLIDAVPLPELTIHNQSLIGGDAISASIAAASIIAKVERDRIMKDLSLEYPQYGFDQHKGYGTAEHIQALHKYGPCPIHRQTFEPVKSLINSE